MHAIYRLPLYNGHFGARANEQEEIVQFDANLALDTFLLPSYFSELYQVFSLSH